VKNYRKETPRSTPWPPDADGGDNLGLRFEIVGGEWSGERSLLCSHELELEQINHVLDLLSEASSLLEVAARSLFRGET